MTKIITKFRFRDKIGFPREHPSLQISVLYQMFLRITLECHSRMSSAQCMILYAQTMPQENQEEKSTNQKPVKDAPSIKFENVNMRYRPGSDF